MGERRERKSPKGLTGYTTRPAGEADGFKVENVAPNTFALKAPHLIPGMIAFLKEIAGEAIVHSGGDPAQWRRIKATGTTADLSFVAAKLLGRMAEIERHLTAMDASSEVEVVRANARGAVEAALGAAFDHHAFTVVDNEVGIYARELAVAGGKAGAQKRRGVFIPRNERLAREYLSRRASTPASVSDSALKERIGKADGLGRSQSISAINSGIKELSDDPAKPDD